MANIKLHLSSFNAGELSPLLGARFAVEKVQSGCRKLRNFIPHVHGPVFRRPGMEYIGTARGNGMKSSLRGFNFSASTGYVLEFHPDGLQVWSNGQQVDMQGSVDLQQYTAEECAELQIAQVNDTCYIAHPNHPPRKLVRGPEEKWELKEIEWKWPALRDENTRSDEVAAPTTDDVFSAPCHQWAEFQTPPNREITLSVANPDLTSARKIARLERLTSEGWKSSRALSWKNAAPGTISIHPAAAHTWRLTYQGPNTPVAGGAIQASWLDPVTGNPVIQSLDMSVAQQATLQPQTITIGANDSGEWKVTLTAPPTITGRPTLSVQKLGKNGWAQLKELAPIAGQTVPWRGPTLPAGETKVRLVWRGRAMSDGIMEIKKLNFSAAKSITIACSSTELGPGRTLTASDSIFVAPGPAPANPRERRFIGHVGSYWQIVHRRDSSSVEIAKTGALGGTNFTEAMTAPENGAGLRVQGNWEVHSYGKWKATVYLEKRIGGDWEILRTWTGNKDRNIIATGVEENEAELRLRISAGTAYGNSELDGARFLLEATDARVYGLVKITAVGAPDSSGKSATATAEVVTTLHATTPTSLWTEGAWSEVNGFPRALAIHGQRLWFGGTREEPLRLWGSLVNDFENFRRSTYDDASVSFTPAAQQSNALQWLASFGEDLVLGTTGDEWTLSGGAERGPITPVSVLMQRRSGYGSKHLPAVLMGEVVVFTQRGGRKVRQVAPRADGIVWTAADLTVLAEHATRKGIVQMAAMTFPFSILWAVTADGKLLGMTHETEQNVFAWHVHDTDGLVESVAVVQGIESDEVWVAVLRNGQRNVERLDPLVFGLRFDRLASLVYTDGAIKFESATPTNVVTGLEHLNGKQVRILGDGAELTPRAVVGGQVTLEHPVRRAVVGLPYESKLQPMRPDIPMRDGTGQHRNWKTARAGVHLYETLACSLADGEDGVFDTINFREAGTPLGAAPPLFTGDKEIAIEGRTRDGMDLVVKTSDPLPLNVAGLTWKGDVSGD